MGCRIARQQLTVINRSVEGEKNSSYQKTFLVRSYNYFSYNVLNLQQYCSIHLKGLLFIDTNLLVSATKQTTGMVAQNPVRRVVRSTQQQWQESEWEGSRAVFDAIQPIPPDIEEFHDLGMARSFRLRSRLLAGAGSGIAPAAFQQGLDGRNMAPLAGLLERSR